MRTKGLTLIELAAGALLAGVLASAAVVNFDESDLRTRLARSQAVLQELAVAMEAYNIDNDQYIPSTSKSPLGGSATILSADQRLLSTPVSYLIRPPYDPLRSYAATTYYAYSTGFFTGGGSSYSSYPHTSFIMWSNGPDGTAQTGGYRFLATVLYNEAQASPNPTTGMRYDPTNGLISAGDIYYFGPLTE